MQNRCNCINYQEGDELGVNWMRLPKLSHSLLNAVSTSFTIQRPSIELFLEPSRAKKGGAFLPILKRFGGAELVSFVGSADLAIERLHARMTQTLVDAG